MPRGGAQTVSTIEEELSRRADNAQRDLGATELSRFLRRSAESLLVRVRRSHSYADARTAIGEARAEAARLTEFLARLDAQLARDQQARSAVEPFGAAWKETVSDEIRGSADRATQLWIRRYAEAFVAGRLDICLWLSGGSPAGGGDSGDTGPLLADWDLSRRMLLSARAAGEHNLAASLPALGDAHRVRICRITAAGAVAPGLVHAGPGGRPRAR